MASIPGPYIMFLTLMLIISSTLDSRKKKKENLSILLKYKYNSNTIYLILNYSQGILKEYCELYSKH